MSKRMKYLILARKSLKYYRHKAFEIHRIECVMLSQRRDRRWSSQCLIDDE